MKKSFISFELAKLFYFSTENHYPFDYDYLYDENGKMFLDSEKYPVIKFYQFYKHI
jgi:hypothetical protein